MELKCGSAVLRKYLECVVSGKYLDGRERDGLFIGLSVDSRVGDWPQLDSRVLYRSLVPPGRLNFNFPN